MCDRAGEMTVDAAEQDGLAHIRSLECVEEQSSGEEGEARRPRRTLTCIGAQGP